MKFLISWGVLETHLLSQYLSSYSWIWGNCIIVLLYCLLLPCGHSILPGVSWLLHVLHHPLNLDNDVRHWSILASYHATSSQRAASLDFNCSCFPHDWPIPHWINSLNKILHEFTTRSTSPSSFSVPLAFGILCVRVCTVH